MGLLILFILMFFLMYYVNLIFNFVCLLKIFFLVLVFYEYYNFFFI